jgi:hypothetical protein
MDTGHLETILLQLNTAAEHYQSTGMSALDSLERAASDAGLELVAEDQHARIYGMPNYPNSRVGSKYAYLVNCSIAGAQLGFDTQVGWYTDRSN